MQINPDSFTVTPPSSFKSKLKNIFFSCFFRRNHNNNRQVLDSPIPPQPQVDASSTPSDYKPNLIWLNTKATRDLKHEIKDRCVTILRRMSCGISNHRRRNSAVFRYDPLSYSLNFEDRDGDAALGNFCPRFPPSPPVKVVAVTDFMAAR